MKERPRKLDLGPEYLLAAPSNDAGSKGRLGSAVPKRVSKSNDFVSGVVYRIPSLATPSLLGSTR